ncbi:MAG: site-specific integrase [Nitrospira sp.]|nr:site-specific integrase [Nitrospira sp.]
MARKHGHDRGVFQRKDRPGKWFVQVYVNGRAVTRTCDTKSQAKIVHGKLRAEIRERKYFPEKFSRKKDVTLRAWIRRCLEGNVNRGWRNERSYGKRWSLLLGKRLMRDLTIEDLRRVQSLMRNRRLKIEALKAQGKKIRARGPADSTINRHFGFLSKCFNLAKKDGLVDRNPVEGIRRFPEVRKTRFYSDAELMSLRNVLARRDWEMVAFAVETGLRREEQFSLRWDCVDLENRVLTIPLPKGGKTRHVALTDVALELLRANPSFLEGPFVNPGKTPEKPLDARSFIKRHFEPALRQCGIKGASWHTLRHTAASRRVMAGVDLVAVQQFLGHRDIQTTLRYSHLAPGHMRSVINKGSLSETLSKTLTKPMNLPNMVRPAGIEPATLSLEG